MATSVVMVLGFGLSGIFFSGPEQDTINSLNNLIWFSNVLITVIFLLFQLTFKYSPDKPPSKVATEEPPKRKLFESFKELRLNKNFQVLCVCYSLIVGPYNAFGSTMSLILTPFGVSVKQVAIFGAASVLVGVVSTVVLGGLLDKTRAYKISLITSSILPVLAMVGLLYSLPLGMERF